MDLIFTQATLISAHVFLMFWLSRPQTCQCAYACTHRRAVGLGLEQGSFFPFFFSLKKQQKPHNCPAKSTPLCAPFPSTLPRDCRRAIIRLSHLETRLPFKASKQPDSTFPRVFAGAAPPARDGKADFPRYSLPEPGSAGNGRFPTAATENNTEKAVCCCVKLAKSVKKKKKKRKKS